MHCSFDNLTTPAKRHALETFWQNMDNAIYWQEYAQHVEGTLAKANDLIVTYKENLASKKPNTIWDWPDNPFNPGDTVINLLNQQIHTDLDNIRSNLLSDDYKIHYIRQNNLDYRANGDLYVNTISDKEPAYKAPRISIAPVRTLTR